ncbi:MAG: Flp family type IVb pilin [Armatimonadota bacterium]
MRELWSDESGVTSVEYALILALVAVVGILAWTNLGGEVAFSANTSADAIANGTGGAP